MSKLLKRSPRPSNETGANDDVAVAAAVKLAMEVYGCDAKTAAAHRAIEAWVDKREGEFTFWLHIFSTLNPDLIRPMRSAP
ncbi:hypothetical protein N181_04895 [Sinorhizobium fredii USDA 205]|uniref:Uncharacterized protein n=1 Tax=Rhizobium fredii TaxID=380 RepID=A0A844AF36_RHIFR|nr:hypothetical protein [Sinorhizobium fredii]KSV82654.1 hypothetical protein N181_04895 [Sinorhizobium fredii USDA 205]MQX10648.1 hypothetical protein [Sinorhizobium fredii]GEC30914.1 hypothetical protein EFR01_10850 [Sinorhizobium fredii]GLS10465.1 hypothetical protein GCM10007864_40960 [Sinorhizobium fredii]